MLLEIIGFDRHQTFDIQWIELQTMVGNFIIQPGHAPMVLELQDHASIRYCLDNTRQNSVSLPGGIVHITRDAVMILIDPNL